MLVADIEFLRATNAVLNRVIRDVVDIYYFWLWLLQCLTFIGAGWYVDSLVPRMFTRALIVYDMLSATFSGFWCVSGIILMEHLFELLANRFSNNQYVPSMLRRPLLCHVAFLAYSVTLQPSLPEHFARSPMRRLRYIRMPRPV